MKKKTADMEQWTHRLFSYCRDRFTDPERDEGEQQRWLDSITEWAEADPDRRSLTSRSPRPGGDQATVEMWQNLLVQIKLTVSIHFDRYLAMLEHVDQPDTGAIPQT